jgi:hypothetical protein
VEWIVLALWEEIGEKGASSLKREGDLGKKKV